MERYLLARFFFINGEFLRFVMIVLPTFWFISNELNFINLYLFDIKTLKNIA